MSINFIYLLLTISPDGDTYWFSFDKDEAIMAYRTTVEETDPGNSVILAECKPGEDMGLDRDGDFYGGTVLMEFKAED